MLATGGSDAAVNIWNDSRHLIKRKPFGKEVRWVYHYLFNPVFLFINFMDVELIELTIYDGSILNKWTFSASLWWYVDRLNNMFDNH